MTTEVSMIELFEDAARAILTCVRNVESDMPDWQINEYVFHGMAERKALKYLLEELVSAGMLAPDKVGRFGITEKGREWL